MEIVNLEEIVRFAFLKYKLSGKKSMNTYLFSQAKKYNLKDNQIDTILEVLDAKIEKYVQDKMLKEKEDLQKEINLQNDKIIIKGLVID